MLNTSKILHEDNREINNPMRKKYYSPDLNTCKTKYAWFKWFERDGNHDFDGWEDAKSWWYDMMRGNFFTEAIENYKRPYTAVYHRVDSNGNGYTETEETTENIYIFKHAENEFSYYADKTDMNGNGTYNEVKEEIEELLFS